MKLTCSCFLVVGFIGFVFNGTPILSNREVAKIRGGVVTPPTDDCYVASTANCPVWNKKCAQFTCSLGANNLYVCPGDAIETATLNTIYSQASITLPDNPNGRKGVKSTGDIYCHKTYKCLTYCQTPVFFTPYCDKNKAIEGENANLRKTSIPDDSAPPCQ